MRLVIPSALIADALRSTGFRSASDSRSGPSAAAQSPRRSSPRRCGFAQPAEGEWPITRDVRLARGTMMLDLGNGLREDFADVGDAELHYVEAGEEAEAALRPVKAPTLVIW